MINHNKKNIPNTPVKFFWYFLKGRILLLILLIIFSLGWTLDNSLWPFVFKFIINKITTYTGDRENIFNELQFSLFMALSLWVTVDVLFRLQGIVSLKMFPYLEASIRNTIREFCLGNSIKFFSKNMVGSLANKIIDLPRCTTSIIKMLTSLLLPVMFSIIISSSLLWSVNKWFSILLIIWFILHMVTCIKLSSRCNELSFDHSKAKNTLNGIIIDSFQNFLNIKLFNNHIFENLYIISFQKEEINKNQAILWGIEKVKILLSLISISSVSIMVWTSFYLFSKAKIDLGDLVLILNTTYNISLMSWSTGLELPRLFQEIGNFRQALTILEEDEDQVLNSNPPLFVKDGLIYFDKICFSYANTNMLFNELSLLINSGETVGIVGASGSGKSTLIKLLLRNYELQNGSIYIDQCCLEDFNHASIYNNISVCTQEISLFNRTIYENIKYGNVDATIEQVIECSKKACCDEFISKLPDGYNTIVGENGINLSGGEKQRIAIARVLLKNAKILILDEATSAIDSIIEKKIYNNIQYRGVNQTRIIITHRLTSIVAIKSIVVMDKGKIVGKGNHKYLLKNCSVYRKLWSTQIFQDNPNILL